MGKIPSRISESYSWQRFPKFSLGFIPALISLELTLALFIGYFIAVFFAGSKTKAKNRSRIPSLVFQLKQYRIHVHHWLLFLSLMVLAMILHFFVLTPFLFYGFLGGIVAQGIAHYEDWQTVVQKV